MTTGINLSLRDYRNILIDYMPPWMELGDPDLFLYFSLSGHTYTEKIDSIIVDGTVYNKTEWTLGDFKTDIGIAGTGNYDGCLIDIIELIDDNDDVYLYTNSNYIQLDGISVILKAIDDKRNRYFTELNPWLATTGGLLEFWEAIFQSKRWIIDGIQETDAEYMGRVLSEIFGQSSSLVTIRRILGKYGLTNFTLIDARDDTFSFNPLSESHTVHLYLQEQDFDRITFLKQIWLNVALAGIRLFIFCPNQDQDCYGLNYGNAKNYLGDYVPPSPFIPN